MHEHNLDTQTFTCIDNVLYSYFVSFFFYFILIFILSREHKKVLIWLPRTVILKLTLTMFLDMYNGNTYKKHSMILSWLLVVPQYYHGIFDMYCTMAVLWYTWKYHVNPSISLPCSTSTTVLPSNIIIIPWYLQSSVNVLLYSLKYIEYHVNTMVHENGIIQHHGITIKYRQCTIVQPQNHFPRVIVNIYFNSIVMQKKKIVERKNNNSIGFIVAKSWTFWRIL